MPVQSLGNTFCVIVMAHLKLLVMVLKLEIDKVVEDDSTAKYEIRHKNGFLFLKATRDKRVIPGLYCSHEWSVYDEGQWRWATRFEHRVLDEMIKTIKESKES